MTGEQKMHLRTLGFQSLCFLGAILIVTAGCTPTPQPSAVPDTEGDDAWPTQSWRTASPEEQGVDPGQLDEMLSTVEDQSIRLHSILVIRHGAIVLEHYFGSYDQSSKGEIY